MAMVVMWLSTCLCVIFLVSCGNGLQLSQSGENYYRYDSDTAFPIHSSGMMYKNEYRESASFRTKRYLADEFDELDLGKTSLVASSDQGSFQDSGGNVENSSGNATHSNQTGNDALEPHATRISSVPVNKSESKTGGNYMSISDAPAVESKGKNATDSNRTSQHTSANTTDTNVISVTTAASTTIPDKNSTENGSISVPSVSVKTNSSSSGDDITISNFLDIDLNNPGHNITSSKNDTHTYYNSTFISHDETLGKFYWIDMGTQPDAQTNEMLSQSHRRAATIKLSFDFPFYGHVVRNVTIATGGFLYTGDYVHSWLAATQYIAPLMANFDTSLSNDSYVRYFDNGTQFTVQWDKVKLQDKQDSGMFTFQATLLKNGDIIFVYQSVPVHISNITDDNHPVKVGLSDAYIIDRHALFVRRKTIYEYHRVTFEHMPISNWTVIKLIALPTCLDGTDCESCLTRDIGYACFWCPETKKCSNGIDRYRQDWLMNECERENVNNVTFCPARTNHTEVEKSSTTLPNMPELEVHTEQTVTALLADDESRSVSVSALIGILFFIGVLLSLSAWGLYAYRNPHTTSGQFLIKYRPSQWSWRRGEARYTAATIHM